MLRLAAALLLPLSIHAQTFLPLNEVRKGMRGYGLTVFQGERIERFDVEVLGVLENAGPKQSIIIGRLSGGPLAETGVMQGMSGSPVYLDGRLAGAVALAFSLAKEPIAGIRPIEEMVSQPLAAAPARAWAPCIGEALAGRAGCGADRPLLANRESKPIEVGGTRMAEIATPVAFSGFTPGTIEHFGPQLRALGLDPRQGASGGAPSSLPPGDPAALRPGAMITVQLMTGDLSVGADGTVTHIEGNRIWAFGHRFVSLGEVEMPFAVSEVLTLLPSLDVSFKISAARRSLGTITSDRSTAIGGFLDRRASMMPLAVTLRSNGTEQSYRMETIRDSLFTPFLVQTAVFSAIDAIGRTIGSASFELRQQIVFPSGTVTSDNVYSGDFNAAALAAQSAAVPLSYAMQTGLDALRVASVSLEIDAAPVKREITIEDALPGRKRVRAGEAVPVQILFAREGTRETRSIEYRVPIGTQPGTLQFSVTDATTANLTEFRQLIQLPPKSAAEALRLLRGLRPNTKAYVRVWRAEPAFTSQGLDLPAPPPSAALLLAKSQTGSVPSYTSTVAELEVPLNGLMVSGSTTFSVDVIE